MADLMPDPTNEDLANVDLSGVPEEKWAKTLTECYDAVVSEFKRGGIEDAEAERLAQMAIGAVAFQIGGKAVYFPRGDSLKIALRDAAVHAYWIRNPDSIEAIAEKFSLTVPTAYRVIQNQRRLYVRKHQGQLAL